MAKLLNPVDESIIKRTLAEETARQAKMSRAQRAYDGDFPKPLKVKPGQPDDNVTVNVIAPVVDMGVHFLFGAPPEITISMPGKGGAEDESPDEGDDTGQGEQPPTAVPPTPTPTPTPGQQQPPADQGAPPAQQPPPNPQNPLQPFQQPQKPKPKKKPVTVADRAQEWLDDCLEANNWPIFLLDFGTNGGVHGTPYSRIYTSGMLPNPEEADRPFPRLRALNPQEIRMIWDPRDIDDVDMYVWQYNAGMDPKTKTPRVERQVIKRIEPAATEEGEGEVEKPDQWQIIDQHSTSGGVGWETDAVTTWDKPWPPVQHCKNLPNPNVVYGKPDIQDTMIQANKQLNLSLSNSQRIERFYGHPRVWLKGNRGQKIVWQDTGAGVILDLPDENSEIGMLEPQGDQGQALERRKELYSFILQEAGTPTIVLGKVDDSMKSDPSGVSLKIRLIPMTAKIEAKRKTYGPLVIELIKHLLELGGFPGDLEVSLEWKEHLPVDPMEERQALKADRDMGIVSLETIAGKLDYDWDAEKEKLDQEKAEGAQRSLQTMQMAMAQRSAVVGQPGQPGTQQPPAVPPTDNVPPKGFGQ
jgi:hypothetical protein